MPKGLKDNENLKKMAVKLRFAMQMAWHGVTSNSLRSALTVLGVAIGVASVVSLMSLGEGTRVYVMEQFKSLGSNVIIVEAQEKKFEFNPERADEFEERVDNIVAATPVVEAEADIIWRRMKGKIEVLGVDEDFPVVRDHPLADGSFFSELHVTQRSPVAVLGYNLAVKLLGGRSPVGKTISINGIDYAILGVLQQKGLDNGEGIDDKIVIPFTTAQKIAKKRTVSQIWCKADSETGAELAVIQFGRIFRRELKMDNNGPIADLHFGGEQGGFEGGDMEGEAGMEGEGGIMPEGEMGAEMPVDDPMTTEPLPDSADDGGNIFDEDPITITSLNLLVKEADEANRVLTLLLGAIAAVSLLVGGLGIMNIMLVAVSERIGEIGVRRALGARQNDLVTQFLLEALYLSAAGAVLGVLLGMVLLWIFTAYGMKAIASFVTIGVAVFVALGCGLIFGVYPAKAAAKVLPMEALRRN
mgnify:CR=1 FL=1